MAFGIGQPVLGDEMYMFGSNKNLSLGVGDEDDRQFPERINLQRPDELLQRFHQTYLDDQDIESPPALPELEDIPTLVRSQTLKIRDVVMSKLHTAVVTDDPVSNLYICGVGRGGRLGLGDENTQFKFVPVEGAFADRKVRQVALGQNHTLAVTENGELWTWGLNSDCQLGYVLPPALRSDEEPMSLSPRQVFGPLKKEVVQGIASSAIHSVAHTGSSLYCWGRNIGQLALMDADSRSLEVQQTPRKVAASLLGAPIEMVSAIDKATTCLLSNFTVWVFTNYGYNLVKFPYPDVFTNQNLAASSFSHRYDPGRKDIRYIASGDETIAAVSSRGDLFTMQLNNKVDANQPVGSTTNPVKIKSAVTQPRCVWDSRKDGVASVSVGEHGSVVICTESGAVWKRVKRNKGNIATFAGSGEVKKKDFKFERVPYITNCIAVRSSTFGAFSAIRKDSKVMSTDISIAEASLWSDVSSLMSLNDFKASILEMDDKISRKSWVAAIAREQPGSVPHEILLSGDIEQDMLRWIQASSFQYDDLNMEIRTSSAPDVKLPIHGWLLAGRSKTLREMFSEWRVRGQCDANSDTVLVEKKDNNRTLVTLVGVDILTLLNIVVYCYQDAIIPVWKYTREAPPHAFRFRQVRTELMKVATKLQMAQLETAARLQASLEKSLDTDLQHAIADETYFDDGDMVIELDGDEISAHSHLICQRCPFFEGMFFGRSQGQWLSGRRETSLEEEQVRIDLKHISPETFHYVMQHLYADVGEGIFDHVCMPTLDDFSELVLDVMAAANELMLDRLSQICQCLIGKFVTTRNIANLLNEISTCSVTEFKDVGLEYICLQLESMLENHHLDGLDEDVLLELDGVVRNNQLARFPFVRSGRAELLLHDEYPDLALDIEEEHRRRVKEFAFKQVQKDDEKKLSSSYRARFGSVDDSLQTPDRTRRKSKGGRNEPFSPVLRPRDSNTDLIFDMDDEDASKISSPMSPDLTASPSIRPDADLDRMARLPEAWRTYSERIPGQLGKSPRLDHVSPAQPPTPGFNSPSLHMDEPGSKSSPSLRPSNAPWASPILPASKLDLKDIMQESSESALTAGLASQAGKSSASSKPQTKMSQKERKRQQLLQAEAEAAVEKDKAGSVPWEAVSSGSRPAPWQTASSAAPKTSLKDAMQSERGSAKQSSPLVSVNHKPLVASESNPQLSRRRTASPDTRFPGQGRKNSPARLTSSSPGQGTPQRPIVPHSKSYFTPPPKAEPIVGASMADIIGQQKLEQKRVKEAVAKRSLQEIQEEQAFQEWWDQESRRTQEDEARRQARGQDKEQGGNRRGRKGGRGGKAKPTETTSNGGGKEKAGGGSVKNTGNAPSTRRKSSKAIGGKN